MGGEMKADRDALVAAAAGWEAIAGEFQKAYSEVLTGEGRGSEFGALATTAGIGAAHDQFIGDMVAALSSGKQAMKDIAQSLRDTARDFGATDAHVADTFHKPDGTPS